MCAKSNALLAPSLCADIYLFLSNREMCMKARRALARRDAARGNAEIFACNGLQSMKAAAWQLRPEILTAAGLAGQAENVARAYHDVLACEQAALPGVTLCIDWRQKMAKCAPAPAASWRAES